MPLEGAGHQRRFAASPQIASGESSNEFVVSEHIVHNEGVDEGNQCMEIVDQDHFTRSPYRSSSKFDRQEGSPVFNGVRSHGNETMDIDESACIVVSGQK